MRSTILARSPRGRGADRRRSSRFSATVSDRRRPAGLPGNATMPAATIRSARRSRERRARLAVDSGSDSGSPDAGPAAGRRWSASVVVLPAPLAPISATISPLADLERDAAQHVRGAAADMQIVKLEHGALRRRAEIGLDRPPDRPGSPRACPRQGSGRGSSDLDAPAQAHDQAHVVLDQQHRDAEFARAPRRIGRRRALRSRSGSCRRPARRAAGRAGSVASARAISTRRWSP